MRVLPQKCFLSIICEPRELGSKDTSPYRHPVQGYKSNLAVRYRLLLHYRQVLIDLRRNINDGIMSQFSPWSVEIRHGGDGRSGERNRRHLHVPTVNGKHASHVTRHLASTDDHFRFVRRTSLDTFVASIFAMCPRGKVLCPLMTNW